MTAEAPDPGPDPFAGRDWGNQEPDEHGRVRVRRQGPRKKALLRRPWILGIGLFVLLLLAAVAWLTYDGLAARSDLAAVKADVPKLRAQIAAGDLTGARATARSLRAHADSAHAHSTSPVWSLAEHLPAIGGPLTDARQLAGIVDGVADNALPPLVDAAGVLGPDNLRRADGSIDLAAIEHIAPALTRAHASLGGATARIEAMRKSSWDSINAARRQLAAQLPGLTSTVGAVSLAAKVLPPLLGVSGPKNYMVTFENEAEMRGDGGLPGSFGILHVDDGAFHFSKFEPDGYLVNTPADGLDLGRRYQQLYGRAGRYAPTRDYRNSNLSPHYPYAAQTWVGMWRHKTGQTLDGAFAIDPTALSYLLSVSGPVALPDGTSVTASNVVELTESTVYTKFSTAQNAERKQYLLDIAKAISHKLLTPGLDTAKLVKAAARAAGESRLLFWTSDTAVESQIADLPLAGVEPETDGPYFRLALWNSTGSKLDYYISASVDWSRTGCGPRRDVTVTASLTNSAPRGLPRYVLGATADPHFDIPYADEYLGVIAYGTHGANLRSMTIDGKKADYSFFGERGHPVWTDATFVPPGKTVTIVYRMVEPASAGSPIVPAQPMVNPMTVTVHDAPC